MESAVYEFRAVRSRVILREHKSLTHAQDVARRSYAGRWVFGEGSRPFSFLWCCALLDLEPERVRRAIVERLTFRKKYAVKLRGHRKDPA